MQHKGIRIRRLILITTVVVVTVGVSIYIYLSAVIRTEADTRKPFVIDPSKPFEVHLGRGSGWHGLNTIEFNEKGIVVLHRRVRSTAWEHATMQITQDQIDEILRVIESRRLGQLHREYHDTRMHDGTQWVLRIHQGNHEKSIYFNNYFPRAIVKFAKRLDEILESAGMQSVAWQSVPADQERDHEKALWDSIDN